MSPLKKGQIIPEEDTEFDQTKPLQVKYTIHRSKWTYWFKDGLIGILLIISPFLIPNLFNYFILPRISSSLLMPTITSLYNNIESRKFIIVILASYYLFVIAYIFYTWIDYYLDVTIITNDQLINIRQDGILSRVISEQSLLRIQDVSAKISGPIQSWKKYGTVYVETAGEQPNFKMKNISNPHSVASMIMNLSEELLEQYDMKEEIATGVGIDKVNKKSKMPLQAKEISDDDSIKEDLEQEDKVIEIQEPKYINKEKKSIDKPRVEKIPSENEIDDDKINQKQESIETSWTTRIKDFSQKPTKQKEEKKIDKKEGELEEGEEIKL